ncbi:hypothetical protein K7G95_25325 [Escherichia coli]|nr:hypothetical protein K7G95_25325 [Escherichia coli]
MKTSLEEAVEIKQGLKEPARMTRYEIADAKAVVDRKGVHAASGIRCSMPDATLTASYQAWRFTTY